MPGKKKRQQKSGGAKLRDAGKKAILLGVTPDQLEKLRLAASLEMRPVSQFVVFHALKAAEAVITTAKDGPDE